MYLRRFNEDGESGFVPHSGRRHDYVRPEMTGHLEGYSTEILTGETCEPRYTGGDIKRISFLMKANEIFRASPHQMDPELPSRPLVCRSIEQASTKTPKSHSELEALVQALSAELNAVQKEIVESYNNKVMLKLKLDRLLRSLHKLGYDSKTHDETIEEGFEPEYHQLIPEEASSKSDKNSSLDKLKELANQYERRLFIVNALEEQEKYINEHFTTPTHNVDPTRKYDIHGH